MKAKIFSKLKQEYASLGLGDEILQGLADSLAKTGLVTDENIDLVVSVQKGNLESLQKQNDARVANALAKQQKKFEEAAAAKAEEARLAAEKAEAERKEKEEKERQAKEAEKAAKEKADADKAAQVAADAEKTAKDKEEAERLEALKKAGVSQEILDFLKSEKDKTLQQREAYNKQMEEMNARLQEEFKKALEEQKKSYEASLKTLQDSNSSLKQGYDNIVREKEQAEAAKKAAEREEYIVSQARILGIPDWRIKEGFVIGSDADNEAIVQSLSKVAENISTQMLPTNKTAFPVGQPTELSKSELDNLASQIVSKSK